jgi:sugar/nucleoside kinase (ribokinase family)
MKKVVGLGACVLDTLIECQNYPQEDKKYRATKTIQTGGGPVANALVVVVKFGLEAEFIGSLSSDNCGTFLKDEFERYGVKTDNVKQISDTRAFTSYIVLSKESGSRTCVFERGNVPDKPENVCFSAIDGADILHLDGNSLQSAIACAKYAKEKGVLVSLDAGGLYEGIEKLLPFVDILIPSEEFALGLTKANTVEEAIRGIQRKYLPKVLAITQGVNGGLYLENGEIKRWNSYKVDCVDSNGAGDTFHGAFISAYLKGYTLKECCEIASATSAIKCTKVGMRDALPSFEEMLRFIKRNKGEIK